MVAFTLTVPALLLLAPGQGETDYSWIHGQNLENSYHSSQRVVRISRYLELHYYL